MTNALLYALLTVALALPCQALAQVPVTAPTDHAPLLASSDPKLASNKRLVYDFWREVFEGGHLELAETYLTDAYIQHNPNVPTGREGFVEFFRKFSKPKPASFPWIQRRQQLLLKQRQRHQQKLICRFLFQA